MDTFNLYDYRSAINLNDTERKIKYVVDEEKRTVVCYMTNCRYDALDALRQSGALCMIAIPTMGCKPFFNPNKLLINDVYRGKAKCHPDDEWDVKRGKEIARNRMLNTYYAARFRKLDFISEKINQLYINLSNMAAYCSERMVKASWEKL